jgi:peroxiredoxin Q/BCP
MRSSFRFSLAAVALTAVGLGLSFFKPARADEPLLAVGAAAPEVAGVDAKGTAFKLSAQKGKFAIVYFYPKDDTPGCTRQACGIRDAYGEFERAGAAVFGVSADTQASHERFKSKYELPFTLLADPEHELGEPYGVAQEGKNSYERSTFVIDAEGNVSRILRRVNPDSHADDVLAALR